MLPYTTAKNTLSLIAVLCLLFCYSAAALAEDDVVDAQRTEKELKQMEIVAEEFWAEVESEAERLEVTVDYYLAEFY